jgi:p-cumate 2,3-dioxygenase alpha subunit
MGEAPMSWESSYRSRFLWVDPQKQCFLVSRRAYSDPAVFEEEKRKILYRSWLYLGHESELRRPNDFVVREVLDKEVLFTRDKSGAVNAFYNTCTHRGALLCREKAGNKPLFGCPYHGWTFRTNGELMNRNAETGYGADVDADGAYNLKRIPRLEERSGFYFVNFDANAGSLADYLGDAGERIDLIAQHSADGLEVISGVHEYSIAANYKMMCENSYDGYHLMPTHESYFAYQRAMLEGVPQEKPSGFSLSLTNGHATVETQIQAGRPIAQWLPVWGEQARELIEEKKLELLGRLGAERAFQVGQTHRLMVIFPNTVMNDQQSIQIRSMIPVAHDRMVTRAWLLGPKNEHPELRRIRLEGALSFLGPGGFATPDDIEMLEICQRGYAMGGVEWNDFSKGFQAGENTARGRDEWNNELQLRAYWMQYDKVMSDPEACTVVA